MRATNPTGRLTTAFVEIVVIVFAVLLVLAADEGWEERENEQLAERTSLPIAREPRRLR